MAANMDDLDRELASLDAARGGRGDGASSAANSLRLLPIAVLVVALVAVGAVVWFAYNQGVKSGSEDAAPLLRPEGPVKVQPEDPGGLRIPHTDKTVYDTVSGDSAGDDAKVERILPAPEEPKLPAATTEPEPPPPPSITEATDGSVNLGQASEQAPVDPPLPAPELSVPADPPTAGASDSASNQNAVANAGGATSVPTPTPTAIETPKPAATPAPSPAPEVKPAPVASLSDSAAANSWRIQVVAAGSEAAARKVWADRAKAFPTLLGNKSLQIMKITKGSKSYYRARGGPFADRKAATAACDALKAKKLGCIIVKPGA